VVKINLSEMMTFVRSQADTDVSDAPDTDLTVYARAAYRDIQARVYPWPDKKVAYTISTVPGQRSYALSGFSVADMEYVVSVATSEDVLMYVSSEQYRELDTGLSGSGTPTVYTVDGSVLRLWPKPNAVVVLSVSGYRRFAEWPSGSAEPDLPRGFDEAFCWYMLARFYQKQEDLDLASGYMRDYEVAVNQQIARALRTSSTTAGPMIFGGDPRLPFKANWKDWIKRSVEG
jgi:hypothetical protein